MAKIVVIDDEEDMLIMIKKALQKDHHQVVTKSNPEEVTPVVLRQADLILLDVMMPTIDGLTYCQQIRNQVDCPILFLTAKTQEEDMLEGFASGGDDYITKPFSLKELRARVNVHLRRENRERQYRLVDEEISVDLIGKQLYVKEEAVPLTQAEYNICVLLLKNKGQVFSKENVYEALYGFDGQGDSQTIVTERVKNIRQKLKQYHVQPIQTVWGVGYKWGKEK